VTRQAISTLDGEIDADVATTVWETAVATAWHGPSVCVHGDISAGNLLVSDGRLSAVIDFACLGVGDPACDLVIAWNLLRGRAGLRSALLYRPMRRPGREGAVGPCGRD
jgi:aminoglycoside phosphotransferase (APT) family kinase protein